MFEYDVLLSLKVVLILAVQTLMKCSIMLHFIWVFTVYQSTHLGVSSKQRVKVHDNVTFLLKYLLLKKAIMGAQWLSGRVLDSRPRGSGFEPHWRHCLWSLSKTHLS